MLDASGNMPTGLLKGNVIDMGFYDECVDIAKNVNNLLIKGKHCYGGLMIPLAKLNSTHERTAFISRHTKNVFFCS